jgi:hypothetical protein
VRIYPDVIAVDAHDEALTEGEVLAGRSYWEAMWQIPPVKEPVGLITFEDAERYKAARREEAEKQEEAWCGLASLYPPARAAWIARATQPPNLAKRETEDPVHPSVARRAHIWPRAAQTDVLPSQWIVLAVRDRRVVHRATTIPVRQPLALSLSPGASPRNLQDVPADAWGGDEDIAWLFDFEEAERAGMAVTIPLSTQDRQIGFDKLFVFGLAPQTGEPAYRRLEALLLGHHYTQGLAFVAQGTPTNSTSAAPSGYPAPDPDYSESFRLECQDVELESDSDGAVLARGLGIDTETVHRARGAEARSQRWAAAMNRALWSGTLGYAMDQMMTRNMRAASGDAREHYCRYVRGRGPLPAFRVGPVPYGVLPVSSLRRWKPSSPTPPQVDNYLPMGLRKLLPAWMGQTDNVPRIGRTPDDPDRDLLEILGMDASARQVRLRGALGPQFQELLAHQAGHNPTDWMRRVRAIAAKMPMLGDPSDWDPRALLLLFNEKSYPFANPLVTGQPLSETTGLAKADNYLAGLVHASYLALRGHRIDGAQEPYPLLYLILRYSALRELAWQAWTNLSFHEGDSEEEREEREAQKAALREEAEFYGIFTPPQETKTIWDAMADALNLPDPLDIQDFDEALEELQDLPTAELERLFTEALDLCSHRLDAWITSLATKRLASMRDKNRWGCHLGAYGWMEHVHPDPPGATRWETLPDGGLARVQTSDGGYIHAPSMDQAAAAAVLRTAHLTRGGKDQTRYAVNLSSKQVRTGLWLLDSLRQGQSLGALLGYRLERALHDRKLDKYIDPLRELYPLIAKKPVLNRVDSGDEPASTIAARDVVDGLALRSAWRQRRTVALKLPAGLTEAMISTEMAALDAAVDAVSDLLLAESVFQGVRGNTSAAGASLDALAQGVRPPDPEVVQQPRGGVPLTHRFALVLGGEPVPAPGWDAIPPTPRSIAEPWLDAWVGALLGHPERVLCRHCPGDPETGEPELGAAEILTLAHLQIRPLDVLAMAQGGHIEPAASLVDQRIQLHLRLSGLGSEGTQIVYARASDWDRQEVRTFPEILELACAVSAMLAASRPLRPEDLAEPEKVEPMTQAERDEFLLENEAWSRAVEVTERLDIAIDFLGSAGADELPQALGQASLFGVAEALESVPEDKLPEQAGIVLAQLLERRRRVEEVAPDVMAMMKAVLGRDVQFLPRFWQLDPDSLGEALITGRELNQADPGAVYRWLQQTAPVRPALRSWSRTATYSQALSGLRLHLEVAQLPPDGETPWAALPFGEGPKPRRGLVSVVMNRAEWLDPNMPWAGLLVDEWTEIIPSETEITGLTFHYDAPGAEAPQAVLIAVPPTTDPSWDERTMADILSETLELSQIRMVDGDLLGELGQLLPALLVASNQEGHAAGIDFSDLVIGDPKIVKIV